MRQQLGALGSRLVGAVTPGNGHAAPGGGGIPEALPEDEFEMVRVDAGCLWISRRDQVMRPYMARASTWEPDEGAVLRSLVKPGCRFLDIGANVGYFSVLVHGFAPGIHVDAVEPDPTNLRALRFNLWANGVNASVWPLALDDQERVLHLSGNANNLGDLRSARVGQGAATSGWTVPAASGDEIFADRGFDVVKLDVQGWELEILLGLSGVLRRSPGVQVVAEFWPAALRERDRQPVEVLHRYVEMGFHLRVVVHAEPTELAMDEIVRMCDSGGPDGQVNLLLSR